MARQCRTLKTSQEHRDSRQLEAAMSDTETQPEGTVSGSNSRVDMLTGNKNALFIVAAILGSGVSVTLFDILVLFT